jgi:hypothetical protein
MGLSLYTGATGFPGRNLLGALIRVEIAGANWLLPCGSDMRVIEDFSVRCEDCAVVQASRGGDDPVRGIGKECAGQGVGFFNDLLAYDLNAPAVQANVMSESGFPGTVY